MFVYYNRSTYSGNLIYADEGANGATLALARWSQLVGPVVTVNKELMRPVLSPPTELVDSAKSFFQNPDVDMSLICDKESECSQ